MVLVLPLPVADQMEGRRCAFPIECDYLDPFAGFHAGEQRVTGRHFTPGDVTVAPRGKRTVGLPMILDCIVLDFFPATGGVRLYRRSTRPSPGPRSRG